MGASQSSAAGGAGGKGGKARPQTADGIDVQDYYGLLELPEPSAAASSSDEIRKAYRKLALRYHPDKNPDNVEFAQQRFTLIQAAYEVLSDEQERAWYDAHREQILGGHMDDDGDGDYYDDNLDEEAFQNFRSGKSKPPPAPQGSSLPGLTPRQLMRFLDASLCMDTSPPSADESGFYGTFRRVFERLAEEEKNAAPYPSETSPPYEEYPSFGYSHTPYLHPKDAEAPLHQTQARDFYTAWSSFSSRKGFGWRDGYRLQDAPDRRVKRIMEKENKRARESGRRDYNDVVRSLVAFVRKRDPRVKAHMAKTGANGTGMASAEEMQRRREAAERERREQEERARAYRKQNWDAWDNAELDASDADFSEEDSDASFGEEIVPQSIDGEHDEEQDEGFDGDVLECFACDKQFQSQAALENHERSNKHKKHLQKLRRDMQREDKELREAAENLNLGELGNSGERNAPSAPNDAGVAIEDDSATAGLSKKARQRLKKRQKEQEKVASTTNGTGTPDVAGSEGDVAENTASIAPEQGGSIRGEEEDNTGTADKSSKKGRRSKKNSAAEAGNAKERCNVCRTPFTSRSKLFSHIRESGHALAFDNDAAMGSAKSKRR